jgi:L-fuconolactonase
MVIRIDAHQHFWDPARNRYGWMRGLHAEAARRLDRPILPPELEPILAHQHIDKTVLVQAAPSDTEGDFLLSLADEHDFIAGAVVWLDMESAGFEGKLDALRTRPKFLGVRPMIQDIEDLGWMLGPNVQRAFGALEERQVCFDFLIKPHQLPPSLKILDQFPGLRAVVDHLAKPNIAGRELAPWDALMRRVAEHPNVYCKLSGLITEADHEHWSPQELAPYIQHGVRCFGPERCMFGSDWPVCTLAGSYEQVVSALEQGLLPLQLGAASLSRIFGGTAAEFYRLQGPGAPGAGAL